MRKISSKGKAIIAVFAFLLITPLVVFYVLEEAGVFDTRSQASLELTDEMKKGDLDGNEAIQIADYSIWLTYWRSYKDSGTYTQAGDLDQDGAVAISDFVIWLSLWNQYKALVDEEEGGNSEGTSSEFGDGSDGNAVVSTASVNLNESSLVGRSCADAVNYSVTGFESNNTVAVVNKGASGCIEAGDEVLVINLSGTSASVDNVGNYEVLKVSSVSGDRITFSSALTKTFGKPSEEKIMLQRIPQYKDLTVNSGSTVTISAWDGKTGGVLFFRVSGTLTLNGTLSVDGKGYRGGAAAATYSSNAGAGEGLFYYASDSDTSGKGGKGGGDGNLAGYVGTFSGGGGSGAYNSYSTTVAKGSTTSGATGGGGGGSVKDVGDDNGEEQSHGGNGGGGGYSTAGSGGIAGRSSTSGNGKDGTATSAGDGGKGESYYSGKRRSGGGGGGGSVAGVANLSKLLFGGGGGGGGTTDETSTSKGTKGGNGGGIIYIGASSIIIGDSGKISSNGETPKVSAFRGGEGGAGAGGSVKLMGGILTLGTGLVTAKGGTTADGGGAGGLGRIYIGYVSTYSGSTTPGASTAKISQ